MKLITNIVGGLAGAVALNLLHETVRRVDHKAPRIDLIGEEALSTSLDRINVTPPKGNKLYAATLAGDLVSNALYFSMIGNGKDKHLVRRGLFFGLAAGIGALTITKPLGLSDAPVTRSGRTKVMTVAWYAFGGICAGLAIKALRGKKK